MIQYFQIRTKFHTWNWLVSINGFNKTLVCQGYYWDWKTQVPKNIFTGIVSKDYRRLLETWNASSLRPSTASLENCYLGDQKFSHCPNLGDAKLLTFPKLFFLNPGTCLKNPRGTPRQVKWTIKPFLVKGLYTVGIFMLSLAILRAHVQTK